MRGLGTLRVPSGLVPVPLVYSRSVLIHLRNAYASRQNVVRPTMGHVITRLAGLI